MKISPNLVETVEPEGRVENLEAIRAATEGYFFDLHADVWHLDKDTSLDVSRAARLFDSRSSLGFRKALALYASNYSANYAKNICDMVANILEKTEESFLSPEALINFRDSLRDDQDWHAGVARSFLKKWYELGYNGVSEDVIDLLSGWRIKGNKKGDAVKRKDPKQGPLSDIELSAFNEGVVAAYEKETIDISDAAMCLILSHTGRRPVQISHLKCGDLKKANGKDGGHEFLLMVPRAKTRGGFRSELKSFPVTKELFSLLKLQSLESQRFFEDAAGRPLNDAEASLLPLFPNTGKMFDILKSERITDILNTDKLHIQTREITKRIKKTVRCICLISERTGEELHVNSRRFRYTFGTRAAREGLGELIIAELLDHKDTQNAGVYIKNIPEHVQNIDEAVGFQLIKYAQAFSGTLVDSEKKAIRGDDPTSRIRTQEGNPVGTCGEFGFCGAGVPVPCYTCIHFQAWRDGPHQELYDMLIEERERVIRDTGDEQIGAVLDRTILAVAEVIELCRKGEASVKERE